MRSVGGECIHLVTLKIMMLVFVLFVSVLPGVAEAKNHRSVLLTPVKDPEPAHESKYFPSVLVYGILVHSKMVTMERGGGREGQMTNEDTNKQPMSVDLRMVSVDVIFLLYYRI